MLHYFQRPKLPWSGQTRTYPSPQEFSGTNNHPRSDQQSLHWTHGPPSMKLGNLMRSNLKVCRSQALESLSIPASAISRSNSLSSTCTPRRDTSSFVKALSSSGLFNVPDASAPHKEHCHIEAHTQDGLPRSQFLNMVSNWSGCGSSGSPELGGVCFTSSSLRSVVSCMLTQGLW